MPPKLNPFIFFFFYPKDFIFFSVICILNKLLFVLSSDLIPSAVYILEESIHHWYKEKFYQKKDNYLKWYQEPNLILLARIVSKCWHDQMGPNVNAERVRSTWCILCLTDMKSPEVNGVEETELHFTFLIPVTLSWT